MWLQWLKVRPVRDPAEFTTTRMFMMYVGSIYDGTWRSIVVAVLRSSFIFLGLIQYITKLVKILKGEDYESRLITVECFHWINMHAFCFNMQLYFLMNSPTFVRLENAVKSGFYNYGDQLTEDLKDVRRRYNMNAQRYTFTFTGMCLFAHVINYIKTPLLKGGWNLPYPMWMPFEINSWFRYFVAMFWQWIIPSAMMINGISSWNTFVAMSQHLLGEFRILRIMLKGIDNITEQKGSPEEIEYRLLTRIKECVQHHLVLHKFFADLQKYAEIVLVVAAFGAVFVLCSLVFLITSPESSFAVIAPVLFNLLPEMMYPGFLCIMGQLIADASNGVGEVIYNMEWHMKPLAAQRDLLMMLVGSAKPMQLSALGLQEFSLRGLSDIFKATYTCFNALMVINDR